MQQTKKKTMRN